MEENENDIETARGMSWCKIHKYWHDTIDGCPDCKSEFINKTNLGVKNESRRNKKRT